MSGAGAIGGAKRAARIRRIVEDVMERRARGESAPDAEVIAAHGELMPDLARELSLLSMLERARHSVTGRSQSGRGAERAIEPLGEDAFEGFRIVRELKRGGQGVVYEGVQTSTGRRVAIKMMREGFYARDRDGERFEREVRILGQLEHPGIVRILSSGIRGGHFYYAMDFVEGRPLDQYAEGVGRNAEHILRVMEKVADAVSAAHLRGIIHRDLKPANILVDDAGVPRILDFGLARVVSEVDRRMTATGQFIGSMPWASPEQAVGNPAKIDLRTDVYSLGVILYQALTGRFPYDVDAGPREALENIVSAAPARPRSVSAGVDASAEAITLKCLSKEPERRYQSAGEVAADIRRYLTGKPVLAHPPSFWYQARSMARRNRALVAGSVAVVLALVLGLIGTSVGMAAASAARKRAVGERDEAQRNAYAASIAAADSALRVDDSGLAKAQLRAAPEHLRGWEWKYLAAQADRSRETLGLAVWDARVTPRRDELMAIGHDATVCITDLRGERVRWSAEIPDDCRGGILAIIGFSRDGKWAVTQHEAWALVWDMASGRLERRLDMGWRWGYAEASFSPDGTRMVTCGRGGEMQVWNLASGEKVAERGLGVVYSAGADYSPDGGRIAVSVDGGVDILDAGTLKTVRELRTVSRGHPDHGYVRYTKDGARVVASCGSFVAAFDVEGKLPVEEFHGGGHTLMAFDLNEDETRLAAGSWDRTARVWDFRTGKMEASLGGHEERVLSACFAGNTVVTTGAEGVVKSWDAADMRGAVRVRGVLRVDVLPTPPLLPGGAAAGGVALAFGIGKPQLLDLDTQAQTELSLGLAAHPWEASVSRDGQWVVTVDSEKSVAKWNVKTGERVWESSSTHGPLRGTGVSADGSIVGTMSHEAIEFWDGKTGTLTHSIPWEEHHHQRIWFHPSAPRAVVAAFWGSFVVFDLNTWEKRIVDYPKELGSPLVVHLAFSADGAKLAACDLDGGVAVFETATWKLVRRVTGMKPGVWAAAFSPDGKRLAAGSQDRTVHVFDTGDWRETLILRGHTGTVGSIEWTPDGRRLVTAGSDGTVRIWDAGPARWKP